MSTFTAAFPAKTPASSSPRRRTTSGFQPVARSPLPSQRRAPEPQTPDSESADESPGCVAQAMQPGTNSSASTPAPPPFHLPSTCKSSPDNKSSLHHSSRPTTPSPANPAADKSPYSKPTQNPPAPSELPPPARTGSPPSRSATPGPARHARSAVPTKIPKSQTASRTSARCPGVPTAVNASCSASTVADSGSSARTASPATSAGSHAFPSSPPCPAPRADSPAQNHRHKTAPAPRTHPHPE